MKKAGSSEPAFSSAQNRIRTCTPLRAPAPQAGVSTNSTTWAFIGLYCLMVSILKCFFQKLRKDNVI